MAYTKQLTAQCNSSGCSEMATLKVITRHGLLVGKYCSICAAIKLKEHDKLEAQEKHPAEEEE